MDQSNKGFTENLKYPLYRSQLALERSLTYLSSLKHY